MTCCKFITVIVYSFSKTIKFNSYYIKFRSHKQIMHLNYVTRIE